VRPSGRFARQPLGHAVKIGVIGAGRIGGTLAARLVAAGHEVAISNSRDPATLQGAVDGARPMTVEDAGRFGEVIVVSIPFRRYREVPADAVHGKLVIDTNNYYPQRDGHFPELDDGSTTSSELVQAHLPDARVVKAFNAISWTNLRDAGRPAGDPARLGIPFSGDDEGAKRTVAELIDEIGFDPVDAGTLAHGGRKHQVDAPAYGKGLPTAELRSRLSTPEASSSA
jgi:8-hydroxy-5-deazaflavin:NADPH oxidoreductase